MARRRMVRPPQDSERLDAARARRGPAGDAPGLAARRGRAAGFSNKLGGLRELMTYFGLRENRTKKCVTRNVAASFAQTGAPRARPAFAAPVDASRTRNVPACHVKLKREAAEHFRMVAWSVGQRTPPSLSCQHRSWRAGNSYGCRSKPMPAELGNPKKIKYAVKDGCVLVSNADQYNTFTFRLNPRVCPGTRLCGTQR